MELFRLFGSIFVDSSAADSSMQKTESKASQLAGSIGNGVKTVAAFGTAMTAAAVTAGAAFVNMASDYDDSFAQVNTLLHGTTEEIEAYKQALLAASSEAGVSTEEYCSAVYNAISAGQDQADAINFVNESLKLSKGGFTDATTAVDILTTALNAYGMESDQVTSIADKLIMTQNLGKTTVDELASSMGKIIPTANSLGVDIDELCTGYAVLTSNGIATAESTTYMNSMLNELGKSGSKANSALKSYTETTFGTAMSLNDLMDSGYGLNEVVVMLSEAAEESGMSIADMFGSAEAGKAAQVLLTNADKFEDVFWQMKDSAGATQEAYETMTDTMSYKTDVLKTNLKNAAISVGESLMPTVMQFMDMLMEYLPVFLALIEQLGPIIGDLFADLLPPLMELINSVLPIIMDLINQMLPPITEILSTLLPILSEMLQIILPPLMQIVSAILPALSQLLLAIAPILQAILPLLEPILNLIIAIIEPIMNLINMVLPTVIELITLIVSTLVDFLQPAITLIANILETVLGAAFIALGPIIEKVLEITKVVFTSIKAVIDPIVKFIYENVSGTFEKMKNAVSQIFESMSDSISGIFNGIWDTIKSVINSILGGIEGMANGVVGGINKVVQALNSLKFTVPDWVPGLGGKEFGFNLSELAEITLPRLEKGGVLEKGQTGFLEGNGAEAVVPLEKNEKWIHAVADDMNQAVGNNESIELLKEMNENLTNMIELLPDMMLYAIENGLKFNINKREFGRLVRAVD